MANEVNETFIKTESRTEFDAIHPRFKPEDNAAALQYQRENYYFCKQCNLFFAPTVTGLNTHFQKPIRGHSPSGSCFYCQGKVFEYQINDCTRVFHNCPRAT